MSEELATRSPLWLIAVIATVLVADAALYKRVFEQLGSTGGAIFMVAGSIFVVWCVWRMERRKR